MLHLKIGLIGAHGVGKTTVFKGVVDRMPWIGQVTEAARRCPHPINERAGFEAQEWIFREQVKEECKYPLDKVVLCDRTTLDQIAYIDHAYRVGNMSDEQAIYLRKKCYGWAETYDYLIYYPISFPLQPDSVRSGNKQFQREIDETLRGIIGATALWYPIETEPSDSIEERVDRIVKIIEEEHGLG